MKSKFLYFAFSIQSPILGIIVSISQFNFSRNVVLPMKLLRIWKHLFFLYKFQVISLPEKESPYIPTSISFCSLILDKNDNFPRTSISTCDDKEIQRIFN